MQLKELEEKMEKINEEASAWSEFKNPEGRCYFYNTKTLDSTWDKPIVFSDVIGKKIDYFSISFRKFSSSRRTKSTGTYK